MMKFYDVDGDGNITYEEFIRGLRDPLSERRKNMVNKAFALIDRDNSDQITIADIDVLYDVSRTRTSLMAPRRVRKFLKSSLTVLTACVETMTARSADRNGATTTRISP